MNRAATNLHIILQCRDQAATNEKHLCSRQSPPPENVMTKFRIGHSKSVLIVDNDLNSLEGMTANLRDRGLKVHVAPNGNRAIRLATEHRSAFILMDHVAMSGRAGFCRPATTRNTGTIAVLKNLVAMNSVARFFRDSFNCATGTLEDNNQFTA
jgi:PleD family two-component response regulator